MPNMRVRGLTPTEAVGPADDVADARGTGPRSVLRVMEILAAVAGRPDGCTLTEIAEALSLPKTSSFSLLKALEAGGYLSQVQTRYVLGTAAMKLGSRISQAVSFPRCARPILERLAETTGETIMLGVLSDEGHEVAYVDIVESDAPLRFTVRIGNRRPLYSAASGKVLLAYLPTRDQRSYLKKTTFIRFTEETSSKAELAKLLPGIVAQGLAVDTNGIVDGATGIASPCFDGSARIACAVSIAGPTTRLLAQRDRLGPLTKDAGEEISRVLGYRGAYPAPAPQD